MRRSRLALSVISLRRKIWSLSGVKRTLTNRCSKIVIDEYDVFCSCRVVKKRNWRRSNNTPCSVA